MQAARKALLDAITSGSEQTYLECARTLVLRGDLQTALGVFSAGFSRYPDSGELCLGMAGLNWELQQPAQAEALLRAWLAQHPHDVAATFLLTRLLREQGRMHAAVAAIHALFSHGRQDAETVIQAVEMLDDYARPSDAAMLCEAEIVAGSTDPRIHAYAGMLSIQLGMFERVRERYTFALDHEPQAVNWNIPIGLSSLQRYRDAQHPDFALFRALLERPLLNDGTRTTTLFAIGKAYDDIGDFAQAVRYLSEANARAHANSNWSRKQWNRIIEARIASSPYPYKLAEPTDWIPVFVVGVPRSGTTLLADQLARYPQVCHRGELGWLQVVAERLPLDNPPNQASLEEAAAIYAAQLKQDDSQAHWYIDKQPLNLLYVDLIMALWPNARIIHCRRDARDTALSLWMQSFHDRAHDYAYDLHDIAAVIQGCRRLMKHWEERYPASIRTVQYETLVTAPDENIASLAEWLALPETPQSGQPNRSISTASVWQARQPIYTRSAGRWRDYAPYLPDLMRIPEH
ncbi:tetratricopeptide repeat-containing sulfotransferase family protein [Dyella sp. 20L07]|uniref:tetratricopeptide repeat-containing sulfotransferase family protein n=1 Tax=Dyella sp. 20L07 TaxID=3384240 RepID=UPI003D2C5F5D